MCGEMPGFVQGGYLEIGFGETYIGMDRRQKTPEGVRIGPNPEGDRQEDLCNGHKDEEDRPRVIYLPVPVTRWYYITITYTYPLIFRCSHQSNQQEIPWRRGHVFAGAGADINPAVLVADDEYRDTFYSDVIFTEIYYNDVYNIMRCGMKKVIPELETCLKEYLCS